MINLLFAKANYLAAACATHNFFFLPPWYEYLKLQPDVSGCSVVFKFPGDILAVGLAITDMLLRIVGFIAVVSIMIAGVEYLTTMGNSEKGVSARKRIVNSLIGLAIALISTSLVAFIGHSIQTSDQSGAIPHVPANQHTLNTIFNIGFVVIGAVAFLMVVISGFRYIRAGSNETIVAESKRQLAHALVGLVVVAMAATIVNFIMSRL